MDRARPPLWTRLFVGVFLGLFTVCGLFAVELWPFTGWHLFSALRQPMQVSWRVVIVDAAGTERPFPLGDLPLAYRGSPLLINRFEKMAAPQQVKLCEALASGARAKGADVAALRIYRVERDTANREARRAADDVLTLRYTCEHGSVMAAGP